MLNLLYVVRWNSGLNVYNVMSTCNGSYEGRPCKDFSPLERYLNMPAVKVGKYATVCFASSFLAFAFHLCSKDIYH